MLRQYCVNINIHSNVYNKFAHLLLAPPGDDIATCVGPLPAFLQAATGGTTAQ